MIPATTPEAAEIVARAHAQLAALREGGGTPHSIVMPASWWRAVRMWHATLGFPPDGFSDYIGSHELFGLPIYIEERSDLCVRSVGEDDASSPTTNN